MKVLHILKTIFKDWFSKDIKYTLLMILTMFLSILALYISSFIIGSDLFPSLETEKIRERTYVLDTGGWFPLNIDKLGYILDIKNEDKDFPRLDIDEYIGSEQVYCQFIVDGINGKKLINEKIEKAYPILNEPNSNIQGFIDKSIGIAHEGILKKYPDFLKGNYIIVPQKSPYKKGDLIQCLDKELEVIGDYECDKYIIRFEIFEQYFNTYGYTAQGIFMTSYIFDRKLSNNQISVLSKKLCPDNNVVLRDIGPTTVDIMTFIIAELIVCGATAAFCVLSMLNVIKALCDKTYPLVKVFRILGAKRGMIIFLIYCQLVICFIISFSIASTLLPFICLAMDKIGVLCENRPKYTIVVFMVSIISIMYGSRKAIICTAESKLV